MYTQGLLIGEGAYGSVYQCQDVNTGRVYAMKVFKCFGETTIRELSLLKMLRGHDNIIECHDFSTHNDDPALIMPLMRCTLEEVIVCSDPERTPLAFIARMSLQIANALRYMHSLGVVHRDLTPANILLTDDMHVKVCDFGLSRSSLSEMSAKICTCTHRAPELFEKSAIYSHGNYTSAIDVWSLGVIIMDAMEGRVVFRATTEYEVFTLVLMATKGGSALKNNRKKLLPRVCGNASVSRVVFNMLRYQPDARPPADELLSDRVWQKLATTMTTFDTDLLSNRGRLVCYETLAETTDHSVQDSD